MVHTIPEVMIMKQGEQKSTKELEEQAKNVETFNPPVSYTHLTLPTILLV